MIMKIKFNWIGVVFAIIGIVLNAHKNIYCWPCYMSSNIFLGLHFAPKKEYAYLFLLVTYFVLNAWAWCQWSLM